MHRSRSFRSLAVVALMACAAFAARSYETVVAPVIEACAAIKRTLARWARAALSVVAGTQRLDLNPVSLFAAARSFYLRIVRRERPVVTTGWRMCPST